MYAAFKDGLTFEDGSGNWKLQINGRVRPKRNFDSKNDWGAFELGMRYSNFDASDFRSLLASTTANASEAEA